METYDQAQREINEAVRRRVAESGSDELRGKNQSGQIRAMMAKDPEGAPRKGEHGKGSSRHYESRDFRALREAILKQAADSFRRGRR